MPRAVRFAAERSKMLLSRAPGRAFRRREKQNASLTYPGPGNSPFPSRSISYRTARWKWTNGPNGPNGARWTCRSGWKY